MPKLRQKRAYFGRILMISLKVVKWAKIGDILNLYFVHNSVNRQKWGYQIFIFGVFIYKYESSWSQISPSRYYSKWRNLGKGRYQGEPLRLV